MHTAANVPKTDVACGHCSVRTVDANDQNARAAGRQFLRDRALDAPPATIALLRRIFISVS